MAAAHPAGPDPIMTTRSVTLLLLEMDSDERGLVVGCARML